jgi:type IV pilus assembly protein PilP
MVGTLAQGPRTYALVQDGDGGVHRVQRGDYMGTDHGRIQDIAETAIELIEIVPDGTGGWVERARTVSLGGGDRG